MNTRRRSLPTHPAGFIPGWQRLLLPSSRTPRAALEVVLGMAVIMALSAWLRPDDPLLLHSEFPWLALAALVFALRYGAFLGVLAGGCLLCGWWWLYGAAGEFPKTYFVGTFVLLILAGHFSDLWSDRLSHEGEARRYLDGRLVSLTNSHYLLRVSHDRLERELLARPTTVRDSIEYLRKSIGGARADTPLPGAQSLLDYLGSVCQVHEAAIFPARPSGGFASQPVASVGGAMVLDAGDALLRRSIDGGQLSHARGVAGSDATNYLVCAPVRSMTGETLGVFVVRRMPFVALNDDNLQLIAVLLSYYADSIDEQPVIAMVKREVPRCPDTFALELARLSGIVRDGGPASSLVALTCRTEGAVKAAFDQLARQGRTLDLFWDYELEGRRVLMILLALTDERGVDGYVARVRGLFQDQFGLDFLEARIGVYSWVLGTEDPGVSLRSFMALWSDT